MCTHIKKVHFFCLFLGLLFLNSNTAASNPFNGLAKLIGNKDAIVVADPEGCILFSKNASKKLIPASTLKILTALVAIHHLGIDYHFKTDCYIDEQSNLKVKGYGDPFLVSETLIDIAKRLSVNVKSINDIILDDSYFHQPLTIPGITESSEPYDAPNGALCANFNTVNFRMDKKGRYISAEPQTPLLPFAIKRIKQSKIYRGRIVLTHKKKEATLYVGHLLAYFLKKEGIQHSGKIRTGTVNSNTDKCIYTHVSPYTLEQLLTELLEYSNNFMANQLLISTGATQYGPPGSLEKGVRALNAYAKYKLNIDAINIIEGSGISKDNKISANNMMHVLLRFKPYSYLLRYDKSEYYKTGTLNGIRTRAGYIETEDNKLYPFIVLMNTPGKSTQPIMKRLRHRLLK